MRSCLEAGGLGSPARAWGVWPSRVLRGAGGPWACGRTDPPRGGGAPRPVGGWLLAFAGARAADDRADSAGLVPTAEECHDRTTHATHTAPAERRARRAAG